MNHEVFELVPNWRKNSLLQKLFKKISTISEKINSRSGLKVKNIFLDM